MVGTSAIGQGAGRQYDIFNILVEAALLSPEKGEQTPIVAVLDDGCTNTCIGAQSLDALDWDWRPILQPPLVRGAATASGTIDPLGSLPLTIQLHPEMDPMEELLVQVFPGDCPLLLGGDVLSAHLAVHRHQHNGESEYTLTSPKNKHTVQVNRVGKPTVYLAGT